MQPITIARQSWLRMRKSGRIRKAGFWFVDVPRTGTTSLKVQLERQVGWPFGKSDTAVAQTAHNITDHSSAREMRQLLGAEAWSRLYTFSFVRNPWDRALSLFRYRQEIAKSLPPDMAFETYVGRLLQPSYNFAKPDSPYSSRNYYWSAAEYLVDRQGQLLVTEVFKFEERRLALAQLATRIPWVKFDDDVRIYPTSSGAHYSKYYTDESREIVEKVHWKDIEMFGYGFEESPRDSQSSVDAISSARP